MRQAVDAILVGSQTALQDNPQLTARTSAEGAPPLKQALRIVLASRGGLPLHLKLFNGELPGKTCVATTEAADPSWCHALEDRQVEVLCLPQDEKGQVSLPALLDALGQRSITSLLVEGGKTVHDRFFEQGLVNKVQVYLAPTVIASLKKKQFLSAVEFSRLGQDYSFSVNL
jgi:diaminohydroxyphosphoribosylaminopyrimidine deaminase/5-amino-6-(5-phosphoribosylamino)uracil reductase